MNVKAVHAEMEDHVLMDIMDIPVIARRIGK